MASPSTARIKRRLTPLRFLAGQCLFARPTLLLMALPVPGNELAPPQYLRRGSQPAIADGHAPVPSTSIGLDCQRYCGTATTGHPGAPRMSFYAVQPSSAGSTFPCTCQVLRRCTAFVANDGIEKGWPLIGWLCRKSTTPSLSSATKTAPVSGIRWKSLRDGHRRAINRSRCFPEGTTHDGDGPFAVQTHRYLPGDSFRPPPRHARSAGISKTTGTIRPRCRVGRRSRKSDSRISGGFCLICKRAITADPAFSGTV